MIEVRNLSKVYEESDTLTEALRDVTFSVNQGEFVSIMGPSGSGKSTLLHILSFLDRPTSGVYTFFGRNIDDLPDHELAKTRNKDMGFVFQAFNLLSRLSVYNNVEIPLLYSDIPLKKRRELIETAVKSVGLENKLHTEAGRLSGGEKQRIAIARALVVDPSIIFADEPTGNLDSESGLQIMEILESLHKKGRTVILVTHETETAKFAKRMIHIKDGIIVSDRAVHSDRNHYKELK